MISVRNITKSFKDVKAVDGVSFDFADRRYVALLGPNGAGKTTLVEMIEGIQKPDAGEVRILGKSWSTDEKHLRRIMGISLQETNFIDKLTVEETVNLFASFFGLPRSVTPRILALVRLEEKRRSYVMNLSHGMRQKLTLGLALINDPEILILDEPTTGLDPVARREIWDILADLKKKNTSMVLTTHYMEEAEYLCDYIVIMDKGKILDQGALHELISRHGDREIISFAFEDGDGAETLSSLEGAVGFEWDAHGKKGRLHVKSIVASLPLFLKEVERRNLTLKLLECRKMNLDDLFISLTGRHLHE